MYSYSIDIGLKVIPIGTLAPKQKLFGYMDRYTLNPSSTLMGPLKEPLKET